MRLRILVIAAVVTIFAGCTGKHIYPEPPAAPGGVRIMLKELPPEKPVFYTFRGARPAVNFFVLRLAGGVEAYFDACGKCFPKRSGYRPEGHGLACRACEIKYPLESLKDGIGTCYPIKLPGRTEGDSYFIDKKDLIAGAKYF